MFAIRYANQTDKMFWDNIPFLTLIYIEEEYRRRGFGKNDIMAWEEEMQNRRYKMVMTSTQVDEQAQHFYRKLVYIEEGSLSFDNKPFKQPQEKFMMKVL